MKNKLVSFVLLFTLFLDLCMSSPKQVFAEETNNSDGIHDIFVAKDDSKMEQFKARILNRLLYLDEEIDVSDIQIKAQEITYEYLGTSMTAEDAATYLVRDNPFDSAATMGFATLKYDENGYVEAVRYTYHPSWTTDTVRQAVAGYDEAMALIKPGDSDFAKILKLHDWIVKNVSYGMTNQYYDFAVGALAKKQAVCSGYAQCYEFLLSQAGIDSIYIAAETRTEPHAWNLVKYEGHYFHVDCTWDRGLGSSPGVHHTYFMLNDAEFNEDDIHTENWKNPDKKYPINNLCYIENKFYSGNTDIATDEQISLNPVTIKHVADPTKSWNTSSTEHWITCKDGVEIRELHAGNPCSVCGYEQQYYNVTVRTVGNGTVSASIDRALPGATVTINAISDSGYHFKEWKVLSGNITIENNTFVMPGGNVEIEAIFERDNAENEQPKPSKMTEESSTAKRTPSTVFIIPGTGVKN